MSTSIYHADYAKLRAALRRMRITARLTQADMAEVLDIGQSYVSKLERGECYVDVLLFARWCTACGAEAGLVLAELLG
jgi:transcriptional regulator with XRE-family HTH domain